MQSFTEIRVNNGLEYLSELLSGFVTVVEKNDLPVLGMGRSNDGLVFTRGSQRTEISPLDTVLYAMYSSPLEYLRTKSEFFALEIPLTWRFKFTYDYERAASFDPSQLTLVCVETDAGRSDDTELLSLWANRFGTKYQKPLFSGFLSEYQKTQLLKLTDAGFIPEPSFAQYMSDILTNGETAPLEGVVVSKYIFKMTDSAMKTVSLKIENPAVPKDKGDRSQSVDENNVVIARFLMFLASEDLDGYTVNGKTKEARAMDVACKLFNRFAGKEDKFLQGLTEGYTPVNIDDIDNQETRVLLSGSPGLMRIFQLIVSKLLKSDTGNLAKGMPEPYLTIITNKIDSIRKKIEAESDDKEDKTDKEGKFLSFLDFEKAHQDNKSNK